MKKLFFGFFLVMINLNIYLNNGVMTIDLLPDFIGYILITKGLGELEGEVPLFANLKRLTLGASLLLTVKYALDVYGITTQLGMAGLLLDFVLSVIHVIVCWGVVEGFEVLSPLHSIDLKCVGLKQAVYALSVMYVCTYATMVIMPAISVLCVLGGFLVSIWFMVLLYQAQKAWNAAGLSQGGTTL